jgi:hypothetical protein
MGEEQVVAATEPPCYAREALGLSSDQPERKIVPIPLWVERILSLRETCRLRGIPTFPVLVEAVTCSFNGQPPDVSWI